MKKLLFISVVSLCTTIQTKAQMRDTTNVNRHTIDANSLFQKSKKQKTTAWILLGAGTAIAATTIIIAASDDVLSAFDEKKSNSRGALLVTGGAAMLSSIPFFMASAKNKRKANLAFKKETAYFIRYRFNYPALALLVKL